MSGKKMSEDEIGKLWIKKAECYYCTDVIGFCGERGQWRHIDGDGRACVDAKERAEEATPRPGTVVGDVS